MATLWAVFQSSNFQKNQPGTLFKFADGKYYGNGINKIWKINTGNQYSDSPTIELRIDSDRNVSVWGVRKNGGPLYEMQRATSGLPLISLHSDSSLNTLEIGTNINRQTIMNYDVYADTRGFINTDGDGDADGNGNGDIATVTSGLAGSSNRTQVIGISDNYDLDSDNDGISDLQESGWVVAERQAHNAILNDPLKTTAEQATAQSLLTQLDSMIADGTISKAESNAYFLLKDPSYAYLGDRGDGLVDILDQNFTITTTPTTSVGINPINTDGTGEADYRDLDSDEDGIADAIEWQATADFIGHNGLAAGATGSDNVDADYDGILDIYENAPAVFGGSFKVTNTDGDDKGDYIDTDSDNDGLLDSVEKGSGALGLYTFINPDGILDDVSGSRTIDKLKNANGSVEVDFREVEEVAEHVVVPNNDIIDGSDLSLTDEGQTEFSIQKNVIRDTVNALNRDVDIDFESYNGSGIPVYFEVSRLRTVSGEPNIFDLGSFDAATLVAEGLIDGPLIASDELQDDTQVAEADIELLLETRAVDKGVLQLYFREINSRTGEELKHSKIVKYMISDLNGKALPDWIKMAADGYVVVEGPAGGQDISVRINALLENNEVMRTDIIVNSETGILRLADAQPQAQEQAVNRFSDQIALLAKVA